MSVTQADEEVLGKALDLRLLRRIGEFVRPYTRSLLLALVLGLFLSAARIAGPYLMKVAIDGAIRGGDSAFLARTVGLLVLSGLATWGFGYWQGKIIAWVSLKLLYDLRMALFTHLQALSLDF